MALIVFVCLACACGAMATVCGCYRSHYRSIALKWAGKIRSLTALTDGDAVKAKRDAEWRHELNHCGLKVFLWFAGVFTLVATAIVLFGIYRSPVWPIATALTSVIWGLVVDWLIPAEFIYRHN